MSEYIFSKDSITPPNNYMDIEIRICKFPWSFPVMLTSTFLEYWLLPYWHTVQSYRCHLEVRNSIWGDDLSHCLHHSPSWSFPVLSLAVRNILGDLSTAPEFHLIITLIINRLMWLAWHSEKLTIGYNCGQELVTPPH